MRLFTKSRALGGEAPVRGKLNLLLSGFSQQNIVPVDDIVHAIDRLPEFHLQGLREIAYLPESAAGGCPYPAYPRCAPQGEFVQTERRIYVYEFARPEMFFHMLHHEIGHFVPEKHAFMRDCVFSGDPETLKEWDRLG